MPAFIAREGLSGRQGSDGEREEEGNLMKCYSKLCYVNMKREGEKTQHPTGEGEEKRPNRNKARQKTKQKHNERFRETTQTVYSVVTHKLFVLFLKF